MLETNSLEIDAKYKVLLRTQEDDEFLNTSSIKAALPDINPCEVSTDCFNYLWQKWWPGCYHRGELLNI